MNPATKRSSLALIAAPVLASCTDLHPEPPSIHSSGEPIPAMSLLAAPRQGLVMQALLTGDLDLRSGCASAVRRSGRVALVWSGDVREEDGAVAFEGHRLAHGDRVRLGGGYIQASAYRGLPERASRLGCAAPYFLVQTVEG